MTTIARKGVKMPPHLEAQFQSGEVKAGVLSGSTYPQMTYTDQRTGKQVKDARGGMPVAVIAQALEYGHGQNHPRPFLQQTYAAQYRAWSRDLTLTLKAGAAADTALRTVGQRMAEDIQDTIRNWPADNSPEWAAIKGFNAGLRQTGVLLNAIDSAVIIDGEHGEAPRE
ncbi:hypothetical protein [Xanthomonas phage XPP1]|uniref:RNA polymerase n=1 Tax=Xanthomonas phage XPP1 TaxID=2099853 RepID=A0A3S7HDQ5_9CAUD|nr:hypothetical protein KEM11_gp28 [Xanthomonas phage XPP1]AVO23725.1 hypothetical protein [Xanthomonas phage XPP2]AVO23802.1 hypothetical protein [Xanthomonas phage XPP3]AVO23892.1 hypothetical protein [Xanthomonas phage XPP4]AVO24001.1 hypothetical protein [Xanthomonas phage XPP6]AVO24020.1 hypothetical protein [Xanthomonas phage XPP8]AVO24110.1 hypothetical protein [Xanthomonas phage XPP9]